MTDPTTPSRRAGLRDEIAAALEAADYRSPMQRGDLADTVMPVLYRAWPWLRAEAEEVASDPELRRQRDALIKALGASETENADLRRALVHCPHKESLARVIDLYERWVKAGPPPLGVPMSRWWDRRLAELHAALDAPAGTTPDNPADKNGPTIPNHQVNEGEPADSQTDTDQPKEK